MVYLCWCMLQQLARQVSGWESVNKFAYAVPKGS